MGEETDRIDHWNNRWVEGKTGWHKNETNPSLIKYCSRLNLSSPKRVFVPLCGKSLDLKWFYENGHHVFGVEAVEMPVKKFFEEHDIKYTIKDLSWAVLYESCDERLKIYVGDIFNDGIETLQKFDVVWDRGSLVAIYIEDRTKYVALIKSILAHDFQYLLSTFQYDGIETKSGAPRCIPHELVKEMFGDISNIEVLETIDVTDDRVRNEWGLKQAFESCLLLTPKE